MARLASPQAPGTLQVEAGVRQFSRELWLDDRGEVVNNGTVLMTDADGVSKSVKGFRFELRALWQASARNLIEISLPYYNQEFSRYNPGQVLPNALDDASVRREDATGDLSLLWRGLALGDIKSPLQAYLGLELSLPTGQGRFASSHPLVATGSGGFELAPALSLEGGSDAWKGWLQGRALHNFGYSADIAPGSLVAYRQDLAPQTLAGGRSWVGYGLSYEATLGLGWDWYVSDSARHRLALELQYQDNGALILDGAEVPNSRSSALNLVPEARFAFDGGFALNVGWISPMGLAKNMAVAYWGELLFRADLTL